MAHLNYHIQVSGKSRAHDLTKYVSTQVRDSPRHVGDRCSTADHASSFSYTNIATWQIRDPRAVTWGNLRIRRFWVQRRAPRFVQKQESSKSVLRQRVVHSPQCINSIAIKPARPPKLVEKPAGGSGSRFQSDWSDAPARVHHAPTPLNLPPLTTATHKCPGAYHRLQRSWRKTPFDPLGAFLDGRNSPEFTKAARQLEEALKRVSPEGGGVDAILADCPWVTHSLNLPLGSLLVVNLCQAGKQRVALKCSDWLRVWRGRSISGTLNLKPHL